jgi:hypothetical protein
MNSSGKFLVTLGMFVAAGGLAQAETRDLKTLSGNFIKKTSGSNSIVISNSSSPNNLGPDWELGLITKDSGENEIEAVRSLSSRYYLYASNVEVNFAAAEMLCDSLDPEGLWDVADESSLRAIDRLYVLAGLQNLRDNSITFSNMKIINGVVSGNFKIKTNHLPKTYWLSDESKSGMKTYTFNPKDAARPSIGSRKVDKLAAVICVARDTP